MDIMAGDPQKKRISEIATAAQSALITSSDYLEQANLLITKCKSSCELLEAAHVKLDLITNELNKQFNVINQIINQLNTRAGALQEVLTRFYRAHLDVAGSLSSILRRLSEQAVDMKLTVDESPRTLHDFVDVEAVEMLKGQAKTELERLMKTHEDMEATVSVIDEKFQELVAMARTMTLRLEYRTTYASERLTAQQTEVTNMNLLADAITTHSDRTIYAIQNQNSKSIDFGLLESRNAHLPHSLSRIKDSLQRISQVSEEVEDKLSRVTTSHQNATQIFKSLEYFGEIVQKKVLTYHKLEHSFEEHKAGTRFLHEELHNLSTWYGLFFSAYHELLREIDRRHAEMRTQQDIVDSYNRELRRMSQMESSYRDDFFGRFGRYLPASLCPGIMEAAPRYQIFPEHYTTNLPTMSPLGSMDELRLIDSGEIEGKDNYTIHQPYESSRSRPS